MAVRSHVDEIIGAYIMIDKYTNKKLTKKQLTFVENMKSNRGLDFVRIGLKVEVNGNVGIIKGMNSAANINVDFGGDRGVSNCHPMWKTIYFDFNGNIIKDFTSVEKQNI